MWGLKSFSCFEWYIYSFMNAVSQQTFWSVKEKACISRENKAHCCLFMCFWHAAHTVNTPVVIYIAVIQHKLHSLLHCRTILSLTSVNKVDSRQSFFSKIFKHSFLNIVFGITSLVLKVTKLQGNSSKDNFMWILMHFQLLTVHCRKQQQQQQNGNSIDI